jgi:hypothetical protein
VVNEAAKRRWKIWNGFIQISVPTVLKNLDSEPEIVCRSCGGEVYGQYIRDTARHIYVTLTLLSQLLSLIVISPSALPATFANIFYEISLRNQIR